MIPSRICPSICMFAVAAAAVGSSVFSAGAEEAGRVLRIADRCEIYGPGFVDMGGGTCGRVITDGRLQIEAPARFNGAWTVGQTSHAALRDTNAGMLPGPANAQHLRIQADPYAR